MFKVILFGQEDKHCDFCQQRGKLTLGLPRPSWWQRALLSVQETRRGRISLWVGKVPWRKVCNPLQDSCLETPVERGAWQATVHRVSKSWMQLKQLSMPSWALFLFQNHNIFSKDIMKLKTETKKIDRIPQAQLPRPQWLGSNSGLTTF